MFSRIEEEKIRCGKGEGRNCSTRVDGINGGEGGDGWKEDLIKSTRFGEILENRFNNRVSV